MFIVNFLQWLNDTALANDIRSTVWMFPLIETIHVIAIVIVFGTITRLDLRLLGFVWRDRPITEVASEMLPFTWTAFAVATVFGLLLFTSKPLRYVSLAFFDIKMVLILLAGINMLYFQKVTFKTVAQWDNDPTPPRAVRVAGALSLFFWVGVVVMGRFIGFVSNF